MSEMIISSILYKQLTLGRTVQTLPHSPLAAVYKALLVFLVQTGASLLDECPLLFVSQACRSRQKTKMHKGRCLCYCNCCHNVHYLTNNGYLINQITGCFKEVFTLSYILAENACSVIMSKDLTDLTNIIQALKDNCRA